MLYRESALVHHFDVIVGNSEYNVCAESRGNSDYLYIVTNNGALTVAEQFGRGINPLRELWTKQPYIEALPPIKEKMEMDCITKAVDACIKQHEAHYANLDIATMQKEESLAHERYAKIMEMKNGVAR